jgi:hypothetical protein
MNSEFERLNRLKSISMTLMIGLNMPLIRREDLTNQKTTPALLGYFI